MEKRGQARLRKRIFASVEKKVGVTLDISENGMQISTRSLPSTRRVQIDLKVGERVFKLQGELRWSKEELSFQRGQRLGFVLINPPPDYQEFVRSVRMEQIAV